jgi:uncharacterized membrane protein YdbT with pleckstrin-like domain
LSLDFSHFEGKIVEYFFMKTRLKSGEEIVLITKKHWLPILFYPIILLVVFLLFAVKLAIPGKYIIYPVLVVLGLLLIKILDRKYNTWFVSNLRVIEETGIFTRINMECGLDKINNIAYSQNIWGRLFGFGNVVIQTAAQHGVTIYSSVKSPKLLMETISTMQEEYRKSAHKEQILSLTEEFYKVQRNDISISESLEIEIISSLKEKGILTETEYNHLKYRIMTFKKTVNIDSIL